MPLSAKERRRIKKAGTYNRHILPSSIRNVLRAYRQLFSEGKNKVRRRVANLLGMKLSRVVYILDYYGRDVCEKGAREEAIQDRGDVLQNQRDILH